VKGAAFLKGGSMKKGKENNKRKGAGTHSMQNSAIIARYKNRFSAKRMALMAIFVALSFVVSILDFPIFPSAGFLQLDFGNVFIALIAFLLGPIEGVIVCLLKEGLRCFISSTACTGELANFIITSSFILLPSILYQYKKNLKTVVTSLSIACVFAVGVALFVNRFISLPLYAIALGGTIFGMPVAVFFAKYWGVMLAFNLIKTVSVSILTILLYKRLSNFLKKMKI
jgi:riboflavin transporter FmnP